MNMNPAITAVEELVNELTDGDAEKALKVLLGATFQYMANLETDGVELGFPMEDGNKVMVTVSIEVQ